MLTLIIPTKSAQLLQVDKRIEQSVRTIRQLCRPEHKPWIASGHGRLWLIDNPTYVYMYVEPDVYSICKRTIHLLAFS